jgi:putative FmdB family regulatory protein
MPIFEYDCDDCGAFFDALVQDLSAESAVNCPDCGSKRKTKRLSLFSAKSAGEPMKAAGGGGHNCSSCSSGSCSGCR